MKPPRFAYFDPATTEEAVALKAEHEDEAAFLAGGQSLMPLLNMRLARPGALIDTNKITELQGIGREDGTLVVGAGTRQYLLERDPVARAIPLLAEAAGYIGHVEIRHRGTVGGSMAHADPAAELPALALALEAELVARGPGGERTIRAAEFFQGFFTNSLRPDELLTSVRFPVPPIGTGWGMEEVARRQGDFALAAAVALLSLGGDGRIASAAVALAGISDRPVRATPVEQELVGAEPTPEAIAAASRLAEGLVTASDDIHATRAFRGQLASVVTERAVSAALERARGREPR